MRSRRVLCMIVAVLLLCLPRVSTFASQEENVKASYEIVIEDYADLLTDSQEEDLRKVMEPITEFGHVAFASTLDNSGSQEAYCHSFYEKHWGADEVNGILLLIDMDNRVIRLQSDGEIYGIVTEDYCDTITDNIYGYASDGDYYACAKRAYEESYQLLTGHRIAQPMKYISNALVALILSTVILFIYIVHLNLKTAPATEEMLDYINYHCNIGEIQKEKVKRVRKPISSGGSSGGGSSSRSSSGGSYHSSGGSSSSGGGSSHSSGGGGQHKF